MADEHANLPAAGEVRLFLADLDEAPCEAFAVLAPAERARAERVRHPVRAHRRAAAAAALRTVLGRLVALEPAAVEFAFERNGKPRLEPEVGLEFNISRSMGWALLGVARRPIGVDLETVQERRYRRSVARRFFPPAAARAIDERSDDGAVRAFLRTWTRLEAWVKATGEGLQPSAIAAVPEAALRLEDRPIWVPSDGNGGRWVVEPALGDRLVATVVFDGDRPPILNLQAHSIWG